MKYYIHWLTLAELTFLDEIDFILRKWNTNGVEKFTILVYSFIDALSQNPTIGKYSPKRKIYSLVISKQTTLYYNVLKDKKQINLVLFWNNKQNPSLLNKLLR
ncbi:type II toxin-antitoxin system RelE/ParE family toxin [Flavobacterium ranwuense]|uniref:Type II toxin-antitoxin system RelE/ParE family toxin n=1 Tax=Flavobacterium ranwuense TaxID=2541725 RepID=A0ABY2DUZ6_9FLAO|nr:type II toxin-antitoxin system RelE/ParE family toxin [Flavobacterium ranwuense]TDE30276.1 type II toxin-antitoxin system RelE/ParE family toxin [Flavobacterium ranwuense]